MEKVNVEGNTYEIIKDYKNGYNKEELEKKYTDYFENYDYIVGDWAYEKSNKKCNEINNIDNLDEYLDKNCAFGCAYFVAKRK